MVAVLLLLTGAILGLGRLDQRAESATAARSQQAPVAPTAPASAPIPEATPAADAEPVDEHAQVSPEIVAVIGAALALAQAETSGGKSAPAPVPGEPLSGPGTSGWYASGLARQMASHSRESIRRSR